MQAITKNTLIYSFGNIIPQTISFLLLPIYTRYLPPDQYGIIGALLAIQTLLTILSTFSLEYSLMRFYYTFKTELQQKELFSTIAISIIVISFFVFIVFFLLRSVFQKIYRDIDFYPFFFISGLIVFFQVLLVIPNNYLILRKKAFLYFLFSLMQVVFTNVFIIWFVIILRENAVGMLKGRLIGTGFLSILVLLYFFFTKRILITFNCSMFKESIRFCAPMLLVIICAWLIAQLDRIYIENYFSLKDVGIYSLSRQLAGIMTIVTSGFALAYRPVFFELANSENQKDTKEKISKYSNSFIIILFFISFIAIFIGPDVIELIFNKKYHEAKIYFPLLVFSYAISGTTDSTLGLYVQQSKKMFQNSLILISNAVLAVILYNFLIKKYGPLGASLTSVISSLYLFIAAYIFVKRRCYYVPIKFKSIFIWFFPMAAIVILFDLVNFKIFIPLIFFKISIVLVVLFLNRNRIKSIIAIT